MMSQLKGDIDYSRVLFPGRVHYETYLRMLQRSDAHVYLTYPFVASWSLREALAIGCAVVGSDTEPVREFITHRKNGLLASFFDPKGLADQILELLEDQALSRRLRKNARRYAEMHLALPDYIAAYEALIDKVVAGASFVRSRGTGNPGADITQLRPCGPGSPPSRGRTGVRAASGC
jgi:glycosyltransferase involved in cell wall biosynthesis